MQKEKIVHRSALEAAIAWLIGQRVVRDYTEVRDTLKIKSRGTYSEYLTGKKPVSSNFAREFEREYSIKLEDFQDGKWPAQSEIVSEPAHVTNSDAVPETQPGDDAMLACLVEFQVNLQQGLYVGRPAKEVAEFWRREYTKRLMKNDSGIRTGKGKLSKEKS